MVAVNLQEMQTFERRQAAWTYFSDAVVTKQSETKKSFVPFRCLF